MMDGRCETCKWWIPVPSVRHPDKPAPHGVCQLTQGRANHEGVKSKAEALAIIDQKPVEAFLLTEPDFGCVQHEPKDTDA